MASEAELDTSGASESVGQAVSGGDGGGPRAAGSDAEVVVGSNNRGSASAGPQPPTPQTVTTDENDESNNLNQQNPPTIVTTGDDALDEEAAPPDAAPAPVSVGPTNVLLQTGNKFVMTTGAELLAQEQVQPESPKTTPKQETNKSPSRRPKSAAVPRPRPPSSAIQRLRPKSASAAPTMDSCGLKRLSFSSSFKPPPGVPDTFTSANGRDAYEAFVQNKRQQQKKKKNTYNVEEVQARRAEEERRADSAFQAWKETKATELAKLRAKKAQAKQKELDRSTQFRTEKTLQFNEWVETKKLETKQKKKREKQEENYLEHVKIHHEQRKTSDDAFRQWMAKKQKAKRLEERKEIERRRILVTEARYLKRRMHERMNETPAGHTM
eukprot:m.116934 g.116934  ORF g.116934 m.116934 type:complete len:382 (-) comp21662_c2_seq1:77-1222(-)